jgi:hypothetical protein
VIAQTEEGEMSFNLYFEERINFLIKIDKLVYSNQTLINQTNKLTIHSSISMF